MKRHDLEIRVCKCGRKKPYKQRLCMFGRKYSIRKCRDIKCSQCPVKNGIGLVSGTYRKNQVEGKSCTPCLSILVFILRAMKGH